MRLSIKQQGPRAQCHLATGIDEILVDLQPRLVAQLHRRIPPEAHSQPGRHPGLDFVADKNRRGPIKGATARTVFRECLAREVFDRASRLDCTG
ncbi:hypothetical protein [Bradyrhizobium sp.]|uniref:hypothetical protein n=1 Tax=Bradyrhizobium sp. TaxID=376 RepID=UPI003C7004C3